MSTVEINQEMCNQCGICVAECPRHLIAISQAGGFPEQIAAAEALCAKCGHCVVVCPVGALSHEGVPLEECPDIQRAPQGHTGTMRAAFEEPSLCQSFQ